MSDIAREPVGYMYRHEEHNEWSVEIGQLPFVVDEKKGWQVKPLYTHPPAKAPTEYVKQLIKDAHCEGQQSATGREPSPFRWVNSQAYRNAEALLTTPTPVTTPETEWVKCAKRVQRIRDDLEDFDGDRRGMYAALEDAEQELIEAVLAATPPQE